MKFWRTPTFPRYSPGEREKTATEFYADDYMTLQRVCETASGPAIPMLPNLAHGLRSEGAALPFGQRLGKEL